jgi:hypothetical protein
MQNLVDYIKQAKIFLEAERVPDFEKQILALNDDNPVIG